MARVNLPSHLAEKIGSKNWTKAEMEKKKRTEVVMSGDNIEPSPFLEKSLHKKFYWIVDQFKEFGIIADLDSDTLSRYIQADHKYWQIVEYIDTLSFDDPEFNKMTNIQNRYHTQALSLAKELGLTMVSRSKLSRTKEEGADKEPTVEENLFASRLKTVI